MDRVNELVVALQNLDFQIYSVVGIVLQYSHRMRLSICMLLLDVAIGVTRFYFVPSLVDPVGAFRVHFMIQFLCWEYAVKVNNSIWLIFADDTTIRQYT